MAPLTGVVTGVICVTAREGPRRRSQGAVAANRAAMWEHCLTLTSTPGQVLNGVVKSNHDLPTVPLQKPVIDVYKEYRLVRHHYIKNNDKVLALHMPTSANTLMIIQ